MLKLYTNLFFSLFLIISCSSNKETNTSIKIIFESPETIGDVKFTKSEVLKTEGEPIIFEGQDMYMSKRIKSILLNLDGNTEISVKPNPYIQHQVKFIIKPNSCNIINLSQDTLIGSLFDVENAKRENNQELFINLNPSEITIIEQHPNILLFDKHIGVPNKVRFFDRLINPTVYQLRKSQDFREYMDGMSKNEKGVINNHYLK